MKTHRLRITESPLVVTPGAIRVEISCPSGCVRGYLWSGNAEHADYVRGAAKALAESHLADKAGS